MSVVLHELLTASAQAHPQRVAVRFKDQSLTYGELHELSSRLAGCLAGHGVRPGDRVGLYLDKSIEAVLGIFGILGAGACYVPIDPLSPPDRSVRILADAGLKCLITGAGKQGALKQFLKSKLPLEVVVLLDNAPAELRQALAPWRVVLRDEALGGAAVSEPPSQPERLAYILYTSGSTGQPKGVMISHRASLAFVNWAAETFGLVPGDRVSSHAPFHFDLSIFDLFASIQAGATLCLVPQGTSVFPKSLAIWIEQEKITTWYSVPSALIQMVLHGDLEKRDLSALRQVLFAGEVFPVPYLRQLMERVPRARYYNLYGPTETNVCTYYPVPNLPATDTSLPIGQPCAGDRAQVLDEGGAPVASGELGELYVSGPTLMDGYWNDAGKTAAVLTPDPFSAAPGMLRYRTGDLVRMRPDGQLDFHGRRDNMVKSRGYRIELGEIETALYGLPGVKEAAVVAVPDDQITNRILAWVVPTDGRALTEQEVKRFCAERVPPYMVPERVTVTDGLPRTSTAKVDRKALAREAGSR